MEISAQVRNSGAGHQVQVRTNGVILRLSVAAKAIAQGSAFNGGEFLMLDLTTCYCNDLYREASRMGLQLDEVEVDATAGFSRVGLAARNTRYRAAVHSAASPDALAELLCETDAVAEVHNTLRAGLRGPERLATLNS